MGDANALFRLLVNWAYIEFDLVSIMARPSATDSISGHQLQYLLISFDNSTVYLLRLDTGDNNCWSIVISCLRPCAAAGCVHAEQSQHRSMNSLMWMKDQSIKVHHSHAEIFCVFGRLISLRLSTRPNCCNRMNIIAIIIEATPSCSY